MKKYSKFIAAAAGFLIVLGQVLADGEVSAAEWGVLGTAAATAAAVFGVKNKPAA